MRRKPFTPSSSVLAFLLGLPGLLGAAGAARATDPGIYVEDAAQKETAVAGTLTLDFHSRDVGASMVTFGLVKPKTVLNFQGAKAELRLPAQPTFRFHFGPKQDPSKAAQDPSRMMQMMSGEGMPVVTSKPDDFLLLTLDVKSDAREVALKADRHGKPLPTNPSVSFSVEKIGEGDYRVRPKSPLPKGEYGFFSAASGSMPEVWAFGVD